MQSAPGPHAGGEQLADVPPAMALPTERQVDLVRGAWAALKEEVGLAEAGQAFFKALFAAHPEALGLFSKFKDETPWQKSASFKAHALRVMTMIDTALQMLAVELDKLVSVLTKLGSAHIGYGAEAEHYDWVGAALVETLQSALGADVMTSEATESYVVVYTVVKTVMLSAPAKVEGDSSGEDEPAPEDEQDEFLRGLAAAPKEEIGGLSKLQQSGRERWTNVKDQREAAAGSA